MVSQESDLPRWRPFGARRKGAEAEEEYDALHEGVPPWMEASLLTWIQGRLAARDEYMARENLLRLERELHLPLDWTSVTSVTRADLIRRLADDEDLCLDVVDYFLRDLRLANGRPAWVSIILTLHQCGSAWHVVSRGNEDERGFELQRRVPEPVAASAQEAFRAPRAGDHLRKAWHAAYGRSPDPSEAYLEAARAVEAAARPVVTPKDSKATLGKMIVALRDAPAKWVVVLSGTAGQVETVSQMASLLWNGHTDRHGSDDPRTAAPITQEQAEAGVHLAVLLVQWFTSGSVRRLP